MKELTDLEICKRIAEIEGAKETLFSRVKPKELTAVFDGNTAFNYNPLTDDALNHNLMIKYKIDINFSREDNKIIAWHDEYVEIESIILNKAICLAIIKSKE